MNDIYSMGNKIHQMDNKTYNITYLGISEPMFILYL